MTVPHQSTWAASGSRDSRRRRTATGRQASATAASSTKMARHPNASVSSPPSSGPIANAAATVAPHTPMAPALATPVKSWASRASDDDSSTAPASPWAARPAIRASAVGAAAQIAEAAANPASPPRNIRRRPTRSARVPAVSRVAARASEYPLTTHWSTASSASRSAPTSGRATLGAATFSSSTPVARHTTSRVQ